MTTPAAVREAAFAWYDAGVCVLPTKADGSKAPAVDTWTKYEIARPSRDQTEAWFARDRPGVGLLTGAVSGRLEMFELEGLAIAEGAHDRLRPALLQAGVADVWQRLLAGYAESTPSGGLHLLYRIAGTDVAVPGNTKIARRPARHDELTEGELDVLARKPDKVFVRTLAETRGEGGHVVLAPSFGPVHDSGLPWQLHPGSRPGVVPEITWEERNALHAVARVVLDEMPEPVSPRPRPARNAAVENNGERPGDAWARQTDWADILEAHGWRRIYTRGDMAFWCRPGKSIGISARTGGQYDSLFVWSSSTEFPTEQSITKFRAYSILEHNGDDSAAATELKRQGFGGSPASVAPLDYVHQAEPIGSQADVAEPEGQGSRGDAALAQELAVQRVRREAKRILDTEARPPVRRPEVLTLRERLARPRNPISFRIEGWQPVGTRIVLAAQFKAGKTTATGNVVRSLVDGDLWLGQYAVTPIEGVLCILDFEMSGDQLDGWLGDQKIVNDDRVIVIPMRGNAGAFNILDPARRAEWAEMLRRIGCSYVVWDCLRPVMDALGLDEHTQAGALLTAFDTLLADAGVAEGLLVHHMGHTGERSRGDSRIRDWPDVEWRLVRQDADDPASPRFLSAYGRDVDVPESQLAYEPTTRHLSILGGSRRDAAATIALVDVLDLLGDRPKLSGREIETALAGTTHTQKAIRTAVKLGIRDGSITTEPGARKAVLHSQCVSASERVASALTNPSECVSASIENALHSDTEDPPVRQLPAGPSCASCGSRLMTADSIARGTCVRCLAKEAA